MRHTVDYFFAPQSPWAYLGHERFAALVRETGSAVRVMPMDLGKIFPLSGGLPLPKRAPQRQAYRLLELRRFSNALGIPLNPEPRFFPVAGDPAARLITAVAMHDGADAAMKLTGAVTTAVWAQERDIASMDMLATLLSECELEAARLAQSQQPDVQARYDEQTQAAIDASVFGAPSYVIEGELFWGQDRLDFVARKLRA
ncbi:2-hydroxychromene-2-carboxylate isomerase [Hydrogenophaga sp.]|uniref:2-hydroxychromene-2-carboxylate isomerase n=1 Tax=Hydrogenophaga sp. TaxID=1904254 RepID=UPI00271A4F9C|nr:2-hydroxychromene-2-carboxylate isomerase [Hydrogenophaga sp.]MDO9133493.1 2-hydroxychromene-2-carboxylate isomerase [Hydrogenophaga sp.]MDP1783651.1 2-hydroxychromene-2-carboxylate isomerase [Hydrogenophaga sp.]